MDRSIYYYGQNLYDTDLLTLQKNAFVGFAALARSILGDDTCLSGLDVVALTPATMSVQVQPGALYALEALDSTAYGNLGTDTSAVLKQGLLLTPTTIGPFTAPTGAGLSQIFLVQATYQDVDTSVSVLPYFNPDNPAQAFAGPNNSGTAQATKRAGQITIQIKAGLAATTGSEVAPAPDAGFVGLGLVTLNNGDATIASAAIVPYPTASRIDYTLPQISDAIRIKLSADQALYVATGGFDTNPGTQANPFRTLQAAADYVMQRIDTNGHTVAIHVADGEYDAGVSVPYLIGGGRIQFVGDADNPTACRIVVANGICFNFAGSGTSADIAGFHVSATGSAGNYFGTGYGILANAGAQVTFGNMDFGQCQTAHIVAGTGAVIQTVGASYSISGNAGYHTEASWGGYVATVLSAVTITQPVSFASAFAAASYSGSNAVYSMTFNGAGNVSGVRFAANLNGVINSEGAGANFLPGSAAGQTDGYGIYV